MMSDFLKGVSNKKYPDYVVIGAAGVCDKENNCIKMDGPKSPWKGVTGE